MKKLLKFALLSLAAAAIWACDDDKEHVAPGLEVTPNNIAGTWMLAQMSGETPPEGSYVYMEFVRKDRTFTIYQNVDSFGPRKITGEFNIETDPDLGALIYGKYDFGAGFWQHRYIVRDLTKQSMTWIAKDDPSDRAVYVRCDAIPDDILNRPYN